MADIRIHRYTVDPADIEELRARRAKLIAAVRAAHHGLIDARLVRLDSGTFIDSWRWESAEQMQVASTRVCGAAPSSSGRRRTSDR
jgi:hypothetical protein